MVSTLVIASRLCLQIHYYPQSSFVRSLAAISVVQLHVSVTPLALLR